MPATLSRRQTCRLCNSKNVERVVSLQPIPLSENYSTDRNVAANAPRFPVDVYMCADCGHVQQLDVIDREGFLGFLYLLFRQTPRGCRSISSRCPRKSCGKCLPPAGSLVIDIGSNDGSLLKPFKQAGLRVLGIDPATEVAQRANDCGIPTLPSLMSLISRGVSARNTGPRK